MLVSFQNNTDVIGLKYVHSFLRKNRIDSHILFVTQHPEGYVDIMIDFIRRFKPKIVGVSLMSEEFHYAKEFSIVLKREVPDVTLVWGGIHPTIDPEECLNYADYVFIGESEHSFLEFVNAIFNNGSVKDILNLAYKSSGKVVINRLRSLLDNLDELPFPEHCPRNGFVLHKGSVLKLDDQLFKKYARFSGKFFSIMTSRGCPFACAYCCNSCFTELYGRRDVRKRSVDSVIEELKQGVKLHPKIVYVKIHDDNFFSYGAEWMKDFAKRYKREVGKRFWALSTPMHFTSDKVAVLKKAGLCFIHIGLQSGSERVNREVFNRFVPNDKFVEATTIVKEFGLVGYYDVILDNPYETQKDQVEAIKTLLRIPKPYMLQLFSLSFYRGTKLYKRALADNLIFEDSLSKNYLRFRPTFLNRVVRLVPLLPKWFISLILRNKESGWAKMLTNVAYYPSIMILEPILWFRLSLISFDYNIFSTMNMIFAFFYKGIKKTMFKKYV